MTHDPLAPDLLDRYLAGESSAEEQARVAVLLAQSPRDGALVRAVQARRMALEDHSQLRKKIAERMDSAVDAKGARRGLERAWPAIALSVAAMSIMGGIFANQRISTTSMTIEKRYTTSVHQRATLTLPDGSHVILAPSSELRVASDFGEATRTVVLRGEAYFRIEKAAGAPFTVRTGPVMAKVLGTAFDVQRYADDTVTRIAVATGRIAVQGATRASRPLTLTAGTVVRVNDSTATRLPGGAEQYTSWTTGRLVFRDALASEVLTALTRWYGYQFQLADPALASKHLTVGISTESGSDALATLKLALNVSLTFKGNLVTLRARQTGYDDSSGRRTNPLAVPPFNREVGR